ncbi:MAG: hypothetical protein K8R87_03525 [Verrucomicrobia bacterium]|nr:hypothetical protein [Verrucomicrobiota bacterium]
MKFYLPSLLLGLILLFPAHLQAETIPADHPSAAMVKSYLTNVVKQDWPAASEMLLPSSLERKKAQMVEIIKNSRTLTEENAKLKMLNVKDVRDIEKMTPQAAYIADRKAVHELDERMKITPEVLKRKLDTLKIDILGLIPEEAGKIIHAVVRTRQETLEASIEELLLISVVQDKTDSKKWYIAPDMQVPITLPLKTEDAPKQGAK